MARVLKTVKWGGPALRLLAHCRSLDPDLPTAMHIRHSERPRIHNPDGLHTPLNQRGKEAAQEFGAELPEGWLYRLHHSYFDRARETAEGILDGIKGAGGEAEIVGVIDLETILDHERYNHYFEIDIQEGDTPESATDYFYKWASNRYPPDEILPTLEFAKRGAEILGRDLSVGGTRSIEIYVSHDTWVAALMYHWLGMGPPRDWIAFMDGFILQITDSKFKAYTKDSEIEIYPPHWWDSSG
ncbi:MAG: histidine phosphatase family protein [Candidatus Bathyarchaeota archaeon]|jgi:broad specificity phosphatase PhoE